MQHSNNRVLGDNGLLQIFDFHSCVVYFYNVYRPYNLSRTVQERLDQQDIKKIGLEIRLTLRNFGLLDTICLAVILTASFLV